MMKKLLLSLLPVVGLFLFGSSAMAADLKIGVVDVRLVLQKSPQMAVSNSELQREFKPRETEVSDAQKTLQADAEKLNRNAASMSQDDRNKAQEKLLEERTKLQTLASSFQKDLAKAQNQAMQKLLTKVGNIVSGIAKENKYDIVLQRDSVPYAKPDMDITNQVIQGMLKA
jgi:outer membrane protein